MQAKHVEVLLERFKESSHAWEVWNRSASNSYIYPGASDGSIAWYVMDDSSLMEICVLSVP